MNEQTTERLVGVAEIAERFGVPRTTVSMWASRRASSGFPLPVEDLAMGPVFRLADVETWHSGRATR